MLILAVPAAVVIGGTVLALETDRAVGHKVAEAGVASSEDGKTHDNAEGEQLGRDRLESTESLGDGVSGLLLFWHGPHHAGSRPEHPEGPSGIHDA